VDGLTKDADSRMIDDLKARHSDTTTRQLMVLRFWDRVDVAEGGKFGATPQTRDIWRRGSNGSATTRN
jgi:hypothetical protein